MPTATTHDVKVNVETQYQPQQSNPLNEEYLFAYRITIENHGQDVIQLLRRHWYIHDSTGETREVEGEGVVGVQPVLKPGEVHRYVSGCNLNSELGKMRGTYLFKNCHDNTEFEVQIPEFSMIVPYRGN